MTAPGVPSGAPNPRRTGQRRCCVCDFHRPANCFPSGGGRTCSACINRETEAHIDAELERGRESMSRADEFIRQVRAEYL